MSTYWKKRISFLLFLLSCGLTALLFFTIAQQLHKLSLAAKVDAAQSEIKELKNVEDNRPLIKNILHKRIKYLTYLISSTSNKQEIQHNLKRSFYLFIFFFLSSLFLLSLIISFYQREIINFFQGGRISPLLLAYLKEKIKVAIILINNKNKILFYNVAAQDLFPQIKADKDILSLAFHFWGDDTIFVNKKNYTVEINRLDKNRRIISITHSPEKDNLSQKNIEELFQRLSSLCQSKEISLLLDELSVQSICQEYEQLFYTTLIQIINFNDLFIHSRSIKISINDNLHIVIVLYPALAVDEQHLQALCNLKNKDLLVKIDQGDQLSIHLSFQNRDSSLSTLSS